MNRADMVAMVRAAAQKHEPRLHEVADILERKSSVDRVFEEWEDECLVAAANPHPPAGTPREPYLCNTCGAVRVTEDRFCNLDGGAYTLASTLARGYQEMREKLSAVPDAGEVSEKMVEAALPQLPTSWHPDTTEHRKGIVRDILTAALAASRQADA